MYIPKLYRKVNISEIKAFIAENSFATLITSENNIPTATHIPIEIEEAENQAFSLTGHISRANKQGDHLIKNQEVLAIFLAQHSYVSSTWYEKENVPTWNYSAVHVYGKIEILSKDELLQSLERQIDKYEQRYSEKQMKLYDLTPGFLEKELKGIIGFRITVTDIQAADKLSQNRNERDYKNIINELDKLDGYHPKGVADQMRKRIKDT